MSSPSQKVALYATNGSSHPLHSMRQTTHKPNQRKMQTNPSHPPFTDLKNATDDAVAPFLTSLPKPYTFTQQHKTTNIRLALGYTAVAIAGVLFYADYKLGWDATKPYTAPACIAYFLLNSALTYWIWAVEAGTIFVGTREGGQKVCHSTVNLYNSTTTTTRTKQTNQQFPNSVNS